jgi:hydroxymethylglutaryl-CoA synthase
MRGIISAGGYVPFRRLDRADVARVFGSGGGKGTRAVASYDEDSTSLGVEAARQAVRQLGDAQSVRSVAFATTAPAYVDKTNATTIHAALRLDSECLAIDMCGSVRAAAGALRLALEGSGSALVVSADIRTGQPTSGDESTHGDGAAAFVVGDDADGTVIAEYLGGASVTEEFTDRWRVPGATTSRQWEERFGEIKYIPLGEHAWNAALKNAQLAPGDVSIAVVTGPHARAVRGLAGRLGAKVADDLGTTVGWTGAAHAGLLLTNVLETAEPGQVVALLSLADGADVLLFRTTAAIARARAQRTVAQQIAQSGPLLYGKFLAWRGMVTVEPPRRPEPARTSSSAAARSEDWKFGFVGSRDRKSGLVYMPPARISAKNDSVDDMDAVPMADVLGTVVTYTVDRLAYSPSPPVVFAVVDFDGGGRLPLELTDVDPDGVAIGMRVEMTFRRLNSADGIHNYFWKGRPVRA